MTKKLVTDVRGKVVDPTNGGANHLAKVGKLISNFHLDSPEFEEVIFEFEKNYNGITINPNRGGCALTLTKNINSDRDIISPLITVTSAYKYPIHALISGVITCIQPIVIKKNVITRYDNTCTIIITVPGSSTDQIIEWSLVIPQHMRLDRKIIYIPKFDIYIGGCDIDSFLALKETKRQNTIREQQIPLIDIQLKGNVDICNTLHCAFEGIQSEILIIPTGDTFITVTLMVNGNPFEFTMTMKDVINIDTVFSKHWDDYGGIDLFIDTDGERLHRFVRKYRELRRSIEKDSIYLLDDLRETIDKQAEEIVNHERTIRSKDQIIADLKARADHLNRKLESAEHQLKIEQEEFKTKREELRFHGSIADQRFSSIMEGIKLVGGVLGCVSLIVQFVLKNQATKAASTTAKSSLVEWASQGIFQVRVVPIRISLTQLSLGAGILALAVGGYYFYTQKRDQHV